MKPSKHIIYDRLDRITAILSDSYLSDFRVFAETTKGKHREILTVNGVLLIKPIDQDLLITAYLPTPMKVSAIFHSMGRDVPKAYFQRIYKNQEKYKNCKALFE